MEIINLTPHSVTICDESGAVIRTIAPTAPPARVASTSSVVDVIDGIPVTMTTFGEVDNLPEPQSDTIYIVSLLVQQAVQRNDVYRPDTGPNSVVRDEAGHIVGVKALSR